jgi:hypothetical protein
VTTAAIGSPDSLRHGVEHFNAGNYEEAIRLFEEALREDPESPAALRNLAFAFSALGHARFRVGDFQGAVENLEEAIDHWPSEPSFHLLLAASFFRQGDLYSAQRAVDEVLALDEENAQARDLLGDIYYQEGSLSRAIPEWERALAQGGPHTARLAAKIQRAEKESRAEGSFDREVSVHFTLQYDDSVPDGLATALLAEMEEAYDTIGGELGSYPEGDIPVILYPKLLFTEVTRNPLWVAGSFDGKIRIPLRGLATPSDLGRIRPILTHELVHAFVRQMAPAGLPLWFEEGLAKHFEGIPSDQARAFLEKHPDSFARTLTGLNQGLRGRAGSVESSYLAALLAIRNLIEAEGFWTVRTILETVGGGVPFETAFRQETRTEVAEFEEDWSSSLP